MIDWTKTGPLVDLVIAKALEDVQDNQFANYWQALKAQPRIVKGAYYFWRARHDPVTQARHSLILSQPQAG